MLETSNVDLEASEATPVSVEGCATSVARVETSGRTYQTSIEEAIGNTTADLRGCQAHGAPRH